MGVKKYHFILKWLFLIVFVIILCSSCSPDTTLPSGHYQGPGSTQLQLNEDSTGTLIRSDGEQIAIKWEYDKKHNSLSAESSQQSFVFIVSGDYLFSSPLEKLNSDSDQGKTSSATIFIDGDSIANSTNYIQFHSNQTFTHHKNGIIYTDTYQSDGDVIIIQRSEFYSEYIVWYDKAPYYANSDNTFKKG